MKKILICVLAIICMYSHASVAEDNQWSPITGADNLSEFMSGLVTERKLPSGEMQSATYKADGTGVLNSWGAVFNRTWQVKGDDQVCFTTGRTTTCVTLEKHVDKDGLYRLVYITTGEVIEFRVTNRIANVTENTPEPGSKGGAGAVSAEEIAAELANPNSVLGTLNTNFDYKTYQGTAPGASDQDSLVIGFQPNLPYPLGEGKNFFLRPLIPLIVKQPVSNTAAPGFTDAEFELGDIAYDAAYAQSFKTTSGSNVLLAGVAGSIPTATSDEVGSDQWTLGPELGAFMVKKWGVVGIIASHQWDIAGEDGFNTNLTSGQYAYILSAGGGWQIIGTPTWSYNHEAASSDALTLPVGIGVAKTAIIGGRPWKFQLQYWNYIESPDSFGPEHLLRFTVGPVVDLPWKGMK